MGSNIDQILKCSPVTLLTDYSTGVFQWIFLDFWKSYSVEYLWTAAPVFYHVYGNLVKKPFLYFQTKFGWLLCENNGK